MINDWDQHLRERLRDWARQGLTRKLRCATGSGVRFILDGKDVISFASNDYLGLATHPLVIAAAKHALDQSGAGAGASPLIIGHRDIHLKLEIALAAFKLTEAALVFPSGYQAAVATISALAGATDTILLDRLAHASLLDGARLSGARVRTVKHNDINDLEHILDHEKSRRCLVVIESLYSMDGDTPPLAEIARVTRERGALLLVDEAHATGVLGATGRGALEDIARSEGTLPAQIIAIGTLSKALGSQGGYLCASRTIVDTLIHAGRAFMFSTALAPAAAAVALAALQLVDREPERRHHLLAMSARMRAALEAMKLKTLPGVGPIIPIIAGAEQRAIEWSERLYDQGLYVPAIRFPTVKTGQARLRISLNASHSMDDMETLLTALESVTKDKKKL
ncbi:MAG: 8-amino-7-oxononanoate synthase [Planctomycetota bacterium]